MKLAQGYWLLYITLYQMLSLTFTIKVIYTWLDCLRTSQIVKSGTLNTWLGREDIIFKIYVLRNEMPRMKMTELRIPRCHWVRPPFYNLLSTVISINSNLIHMSESATRVWLWLAEVGGGRCFMTGAECIRRTSLMIYRLPGSLTSTWPFLAFVYGWTRCVPFY